MYFKIEQTIRDFRIKDNVIHDFTVTQVHRNTVKLFQPSLEDQKIGHKPENAHCSAFLEASVSEKNQSVFKNITENRILNADQESGMSYIGPNGNRIELPYYSEYPEYFRQYLDQIKEELSNSIRKVVNSIRWRCGLLGPHQAISHRGFYWSYDEKYWHHAPGKFEVRLSVLDYNVRINENINTDIKYLIENNIAEPVHHELFREAWELRGDNLRSSLLIGFTSLETAVKNCISKLVPNSKWLVDNLPSPPIENILRDYFKQLSVNESQRAKYPSDKLLEVIKKGIQVRNSIAHLGATPPSHDKVEEILNAIRECLWIIDFNTGMFWAMEKILENNKE